MGFYHYQQIAGRPYRRDRGLKTLSGLNGLWIGIAIIVPVFTGICAFFWSVPLPVYDYWDVLAASQNPGSSYWQSFFLRPFVDQIMVGPKFLILVLSQSLNNRHLGWEIAIGFAMQLGVLTICARLAGRTRGLPGRGNGFWWAFSAAWLFWPALLARFQHHWYSTQYSLVLLPATGAIALLAQPRIGGGQIVIAALLALVAGISHGTGLLLWPILGISLLFQKRARIAGIFWLITSISVIGFIYTQLPNRETLGFLPLSASLESPWRMTVFALSCLGLSAWPLGMVNLLLTGISVCILARHGLLSSYRPWLLIWAWTLLVAGGTALNRSTFVSAPFSHYAAFNILSWIAAGVLIAGAISRSYLMRSTGSAWLVRVAGVCVCALWLLGTWKGITGAREFSSRINQAKLHMKSWPVVERSVLEPLFPLDRFERTTLSILAARRAFGLDPRPLRLLPDVKLDKQPRSGSLFLIPNRPLKPYEMIAFPEQLLAIEGLEILLYGQGFQASQRLRRYEGRGWLVWGEHGNVAIERIELRGLEEELEFKAEVYGRTDQDQYHSEGPDS